MEKEGDSRRRGEDQREKGDGLKGREEGRRRKGRQGSNEIRRRAEGQRQGRGWEKGEGFGPMEERREQDRMTVRSAFAATRGTNSSGNSAYRGQAGKR